MTPNRNRLAGFVWVAVALGAAGCVAPSPAPVSANDCFLANTEAGVYSQILQGRQRIVMTFELVDGVAPRAEATVDGARGHWIPSGAHRLQFKVFLPPVNWTDGQGREARAVVDLELQPGCRYRVGGDFEKGIRTFYIANAATGQAVTAPIDVGFFAPVPGSKTIIPILIPIRT